jgi:pyruvate dehydrogenase E2 component (dihydrolipoamide acetyltransferase)
VQQTPNHCHKIGAEVKDFAQKAKDKKLQPADWEGNTFTISNLGMFWHR